MTACVARTLFDGRRIKLGELYCSAGSAGWGAGNVLGPRTNIAFPRGCAMLHRSGRRTVVTNANHAVVYSPRREYAHVPVDEQSWSCTYLSVETATLAEALERSGQDEPVDGPLSRRVYLLQYAVTKATASREGDDLLIEESLYHLLGEALTDMGRLPRPRTSHTPATRRAHDEIVEEAQRLLALRLADRLSIDDLARALYVSPFHLARVFRANTGYTLHAYRNELRLRRALEQIEERRGDLTSLACELGFASLSHFSDSFQRAFGVRPTAIS